MKKTWVKRENIYYKPFYKQKSKMLLLGIFLLGIIFFAYQAFSINQLPSASTPWSLEWHREKQRLQENLVVENSKQRLKNGAHSADNDDEAGVGRVDAPGNSAEDAIKIMRGIRLFDYDSYKPNFEGKFKCLDGSTEILFARVNDDYCDCPADGSDEPSTNACSEGRYYCKYQKRHITGRGRDVYVSSSRINDGICDCCDGSDEWLTLKCTNRCT